MIYWLIDWLINTRASVLPLRRIGGGVSKFQNLPITGALLSHSAVKRDSSRESFLALLSSSRRVCTTLSFLSSVSQSAVGNSHNSSISNQNTLQTYFSALLFYTACRREWVNERATAITTSSLPLLPLLLLSPTPSTLNESKRSTNKSKTKVVSLLFPSKTGSSSSKSWGESVSFERGKITDHALLCLKKVKRFKSVFLLTYVYAYISYHDYFNQLIIYSLTSRLLFQNSLTKSLSLSLFEIQKQASVCWKLCFAVLSRKRGEHENCKGCYLTSAGQCWYYWYYWYCSYYYSYYW